MTNNYSEILELYAKEALDKGLISEAQEETNPRYDSNDMKAIEILYGVKPNGEDDDVLDKAHPESVIVAPAYDKVNALVENLKERQNVMADIARKPNDGKHTQERYVKAKQELFTEFKKATLLLERKNEDPNLIRLADSCSERIVKEGFFISGTAMIIAAIVGLLGGVVFSQNVSRDLNIKEFATTAVEKLEDLMQGWDYTTDPEYAEFSDLLESIKALKESAEQVENLRIADLRVSKEDFAENPGKTLDQLKSTVKDAEKQKALKILDYHTKVCKVLLKELPRYIHLLEVKDEATSGAYSTLRDIGRFFYKTDLPDAISALSNLMESLRTIDSVVGKRSRLISDFAGQEGTILGKINQIEKEMNINDSSTTKKPESTTKEEEPSPKPDTELNQLERLLPGLSRL